MPRTALTHVGQSPRLQVPSSESGHDCKCLRLQMPTSARAHVSRCPRPHMPTSAGTHVYQCSRLQGPLSASANDWDELSSIYACIYLCRKCLAAYLRRSSASRLARVEQHTCVDHVHPVEVVHQLRLPVLLQVNRHAIENSNEYAYVGGENMPPESSGTPTPKRIDTRSNFVHIVDSNPTPLQAHGFDHEYVVIGTTASSSSPSTSPPPPPPLPLSSSPPPHRRCRHHHRRRHHHHQRHHHHHHPPPPLPPPPHHHHSHEVNGTCTANATWAARSILPNKSSASICKISL